MKKLSPRKATTERKIIKLKRDNSPSNSEEWNISVSPTYVAMFAPASTRQGYFTISRKEFNKMIDWYNKEQNIK